MNNMDAVSNEVSIVIPVYNAGQYIEEQIIALYKNKMPDKFEIVIADNGCTDNTISLVNQLSKKYHEIRVVDASAKNGANFARNVGIDAAIYNNIILCDADDIVYNNFVTCLLAALEENDLVGSGYRYLNWSESQRKYISGKTVINAPVCFTSIPYALSAAAALKKNLFLKIKGFDESYFKGHEEVDFAYRAHSQGYKFGWVDKPLIDYRQRSNPASQREQFYYYGKTWMQLGYRFQEELNIELPGYKTLLKRYVVALVICRFLKKTENTLNANQAYGWNKGRLMGIVLYRLFKRMPNRELWETGISEKAEK